jgi:hypothetical protein
LQLLRKRNGRQGTKEKVSSKCSSSISNAPGIKMKGYLPRHPKGPRAELAGLERLERLDHGRNPGVR